MPYNRSSPHQIAAQIDLDNLSGWFANEIARVDQAEQRILGIVANELGSFVQWPSEALLLCPGWDRRPPPGSKTKYFTYLPHIQDMAKAFLKPVPLDRRANGPAIVSFLFAGGPRPARFGSSNKWSIHHLYSGKFPYWGRKDTDTLHAAMHPLHFTQSAGLIAAHPIADAMADEYPCFAWLLRTHAFLRLGYDPDGVFSPGPDEFGFATGRACRVIKEPTGLGLGGAPLGVPEMTAGMA